MKQGIIPVLFGAALVVFILFTAALAQESDFKAGDRVEVDVVMAKTAEGARWRKGTVTAHEPANQRYVVLLDDTNEISILIRPGMVWIRRLTDGSKAPVVTCEFYKNYKKPSRTSPPSAELFKAVIFEWQADIHAKFYDYGLVFEDFKLGKAYRNAALGKGRKSIDPAPVGAMIYPLETKLVSCEKDMNSTFRTEWVVEYACYKNPQGDWVCKNGAPRNYVRSSFPNK